MRQELGEWSEEDQKEKAMVECETVVRKQKLEEVLKETDENWYDGLSNSIFEEGLDPKFWTLSIKGLCPVHKLHYYCISLLLVVTV